GGDLLGLVPAPPSSHQQQSYKYHDRHQSKENEWILDGRGRLVEYGRRAHGAGGHQGAGGGDPAVDTDRDATEHLTPADRSTHLLRGGDVRGDALATAHVDRQGALRDQREVVAAVVELGSRELLAPMDGLHRVVERESVLEELQRVGVAAGLIGSAEYRRDQGGRILCARADQHVAGAERVAGL